MHISSLLGSGRPTVSFEFFPPKTEAARETLMVAIDHLDTIQPDFVSVTYGAGGSTRTLSLETCVGVVERTTAIVMGHLAGVCHTRRGLAEIADQLWESGIVNIMALRGDRPKDLEPDAEMGDFRYAKDVIRFLKSRHDYCLGGACYPEGHTENPDIDLGIEHLKEKIDAGCQFLVTQMFFENDSYFRFVERARAAGICVPIVPGIMPITGFSQLSMFETKFGVKLPEALKAHVAESEGDARGIERIGVEWTAQQCRALLDGGAPGLHFYTLNRSHATVEVCESLGLRGSQSR